MLPSVCLLFALASHGPAPSGGELAPRLTHGDGRLWLSWIDQTEGEPPRFLSSSFGGESWTSPSVVVSGPDLFVNWADVPGVFEGGDGEVYAFWLRKREGGKYAYDVRMSQRTGDRWRALGALHDDGKAAEHGFVSAAATARGLQVFWLDGRETATGSPMTLRTAHLVSGAKTDERLLDDRVCDCCGTAAVASGHGVRVIYRDRSEEEIRDMASVLVAGSRSRRAGSALVHADRWQMPGCPVNGPALATDGAKTAAVWFTAGAGRAEVRGGYLDADGEVAAATTLWSVTTLGRVDVVIDDRSAIATSLEANGDEAAVVARRFDADGAVGDAVVLGKTTSARASGFPQAEIFGSDLVIVWTDARGKRTRLQRRRVPLKDIPLPSAQPTSVAALPSASAEVTRPRLDLLTTAGHTAALTKGRPLLLHLWATWCAPCLKGMPSVVRAARSLRERGVSVVLLSVDAPDQRGRVAELAAQWGASSLVFTEATPRAETALGVRVVPATYLFGAGGELRFRATGAVAADRLLAVPLTDPSASSPKGP